MHATRPTRHRIATAIFAMVAAVTITACGSPARIRTLDGEPDLVRIHGSVPHGFSSSATEELERLQAACAAIDPLVGTPLPDLRKESDVEHLALVDGQCEWVGSTPELIVGILANPGGAGALDRTVAVIKGERSVAGVGDRAVFDPQTRTLYIVRNGRLWYLQLVGAAPSVTAPAILTTLGRALVATPAATR